MQTLMTGLTTTRHGNVVRTLQKRHMTLLHDYCSLVTADGVESLGMIKN